MPHLRIETNIPRANIPNDFTKKATALIAKSLGKPANYCAVSVITDVMMSFGGSNDACAIANLMSIGQLGVEENKKYSKAIGEILEAEMGIPKNRMYIVYQNEPSSNVGFDGTTFHDLLGGK